MNALIFRAPAQENVTIPCAIELKVGFIRPNNLVHTISAIFQVNFILHKVHCIFVPQKYARRYPTLKCVYVFRHPHTYIHKYRTHYN